MNKYQILARSYLDLQHLRIAVEARLRKISEEMPENILTVLESYHARLKADEKALLNDVVKLLTDHPIWAFCQAVKGLGPVATLTFLGFIDPVKATSAGKAWAYLGFAPDSALRSGEKARFNPEGKGRMWLLARNIIMAKDDYYYPIYQSKKAYYTEKMGAYVEKPELCPDYERCKQRLLKKALRLSRTPKKFPCKGHIDNRAKRWLIKLLISHAVEIMREHEGLPFSKHRNYIPPKAF